MRVAPGILINTLCCVLAGALVSLPVTVRAAPQAETVVVELVKLGVPSTEAQARVAALDDTELAALASELETRPAGGDTDTEDVVITFLILSAVVFGVLIITDATGVTDIFPWVKKPGAKHK